MPLIVRRSIVPLYYIEAAGAIKEKFKDFKGLALAGIRLAATLRVRSVSKGFGRVGLDHDFKKREVPIGVNPLKEWIVFRRRGVAEKHDVVGLVFGNGILDGLMRRPGDIDFEGLNIPNPFLPFQRGGVIKSDDAAIPVGDNETAF